MGRRSRFVKKVVDTLDLSDGDWIKVKRHLTSREERLMKSSGLSRMRTPRQAGEDDREPEFDIDWEKLTFNTCATYIVDWNIVDDEGKGVPYTIQALGDLDDETVSEIEAALKAHIERWDTAGDADTTEKKPSSGKPSRTSA